MAKLTARDNIFAIESSLILDYSRDWNNLKKDYAKRDHLDTFKKIIDFTNSDIETIYYVGEEELNEVIQKNFDSPSLFESPTVENSNSSNEFSDIIKANYEGIQLEHPSLEKGKGVAKFVTYDNLEELDIYNKPVHPWFISFAHNDTNQKFRKLSENKCIPLIHQNVIESELRDFGIFVNEGTLKANEHLYPHLFFKPLSQPSRFIILFDNYLFNWNAEKNKKKKRKDSLFGFLDKKDEEYIDKHDKKYKCKEKNRMIGYIIKDGFEYITYRILFYLRGIESLEKKPDKCFIIGGSKGGQGERELDQYLIRVNDRIKEIGVELDLPEEDEKELKAQLEDLKLIIKYKDAFLLIPSDTQGPKTKSGHNRIIFNDHTLLEWGGGSASFNKYSFLGEYWLVGEQQNVSVKSIFNESYKKIKAKDSNSPKTESYNNQYEALCDFCCDFENTMIPAAK